VEEEDRLKVLPERRLLQDLFEEESSANTSIIIGNSVEEASCRSSKRLAMS
jgi:hypothetical protein